MISILPSVFLSALTAATLSLREIPLGDLSERYYVEGVVTEAHRITAGEKTLTLLLSRTGIYRDTELNGSARLYATLFEDKGDESTQVWVIKDLVRECPVDVTAQFTKPAAVVSDADADGVPEIWVSYITACRGDVSPSTLKLIAYEGTQKYAMRGTSQVTIGESSDGGDSTADAALKSAPALLKFAETHWQSIRTESW